MPIAYQSPGTAFTVSISSQGPRIFAALGTRNVMEFMYDNGRLVLHEDYSGPERERIHLHVMEYILGHNPQLKEIDCTGLQAPLHDALSHRLVRQREGRSLVDRETFFQYPALWHRRQDMNFEAERWIKTHGRAHPERPFVEPGILYRRYLASIDAVLSFELFDRQKHLDIFHEWQNQPRVSAFWEMADSKEVLDAYIGKLEADPHMRPVVALLDGRAIGYFEIYWTPEDRLGPFYEYDPFDRGFHFLIGDVTVLGGKGTPDFIQSMVHFIFLDDPRTRRVMGEPRYDNLKVLRYVQSLPGWIKVKEFDFPHKRAALLQIRREDFLGRQPVSKLQNPKDWLVANRKLTAKAIAELAFEQVLQVDSSAQGFQLALAAGVNYRFEAWLTIWEFLRINPQSLRRQARGSEAWEPVSSAGQFFIDAQMETGMDDIILANFLEEMHRTLFADVKLLQAQIGFTAAAMTEMDGDSLQMLLDGHPKALLNKGRMGWGSTDIERFAPESQTAFQLFWIAVLKGSVEQAHHPAWTCERLLEESMQNPERERFEQVIRSHNASPERYFFMPVHPWQWEQVIEQQFAGAIALRLLIPLGYFGDRYKPQTSLRTMSNSDRPQRLQIKLAVSILNTSSVRGLGAKYVSIAPALAQWLAQTCEHDDLLQKAGTRVLRDVASIHCQHASYSQVKGAPYRYHEYLGAVWRESSQVFEQSDEQAVIAAALFQKDYEGEALIAHWIERSGLSIAEWLKAYFEVVVVPLYHLQCKYGIGIVAHGQNIVLRLHKARPVGIYLKDLQGDLRLVDEELPELATLAASVKAKLMRLPAHYLIHDLQTGHLSTVLRFMSAALQESTGFAEESFYQILSKCLQDYQSGHPELADRFPPRSLLSESMTRVLINKVRFKIGYADSAERPLPTLGTDLSNPLFPKKPGENYVSPSL